MQHVVKNFRWRPLRVLVVALAIVSGLAAAEDRATVRGAAASSPNTRWVQLLGPGPLLRGPAGEGAWTARVKTEDIGAAVDLCVEANMEQLNAPGAAVAVMLDGEMVHTRGYGDKHRSGSGPVDEDTVFRIGSVTKMMTAAAVMQQVELGRIDLRAPVTDYVPEFEIGGRWPAELITVWHTLTHTTGFPDNLNTLWANGNDALSLWATQQGAIELHAPPGSFWNYSNPNFALAGLVAERAAGVPYRELYKTSLWEPAGMPATTFDPEEVMGGGNFAIGHHYDADRDIEYTFGPRDNNLWAAGPAGFAFSTVGDLATWALLLTDGGGPVMSSWSAATMQDPHQWIHYRPDQHYGFGIMIEDYRGLDVRQHGGNVAGFGTYLLWVPERRFVVSLLTNVTQSLTQAAYCIVDAVLEPAPAQPQDLTTDPSTWGRYEGGYLMTEATGASSPATVYLEGSRLMASIEDPDLPGVTYTTELQQVYLDTFFFDSDGDGTLDNDLTFCEREGQPGFTMWLRNRRAVGERQLTPHEGGRRISP